jgi:arginase family enzyme
MRGAALLGAAIGRHLGIKMCAIGAPAMPLAADCWIELEAARPHLRQLARRVDSLIGAARCPVTVMGRCASALATLPAVARHRPDALVIWFDAHADCNLPATSPTGYLGGMVLTGASGRWPTGLGDDLKLDNLILAGARDIDPAEQALVDSGAIRHITLGADFERQLRAAIAGRPVYAHLDCDVLEPGIVPTEYRVPGGLTLDHLRSAATVIANGALVGIEIAEFEAEWTESGDPGDPGRLIEALEPLLTKVG